MKFITLLSILLMSFTVQASALFGTIIKIEHQLSLNHPDSALKDIESLENGLKIEGVYNDYSDITLSLKSIAYLQKQDINNALNYAKKALDIMKSRPNKDPLVRKYRSKILAMIKIIEQAYPFREFDPYSGMKNKFVYIETKNNKTYKQYDSYFVVDHKVSNGCIMDLTKYKTSYNYTSKDGVLTNATHYWAYNYKIDFSKVTVLKQYKYNNTNNIRFIRIGYDQSSKNNQDKILRYRYKLKKKNDSIIKTKESYENYVDIEIGNGATPTLRINEIESIFKRKQKQCNRFDDSASSTSSSDDYKNILLKINAITTQKLSWTTNGSQFSGHHVFSYQPNKNSCGGTLSIEEIERYHNDEKTAHRFYSTKIIDPSSMTISFDRQRYYRSGEKYGYNVNGKPVDWAFYGWINNKASPFLVSKMFMLSDDGSKNSIQYSNADEHNQSIKYLTDPGYYQLRDLLIQFFKAIECK